MPLECNRLNSMPGNPEERKPQINGAQSGAPLFQCLDRALTEGKSQADFDKQIPVTYTGINKSIPSICVNLRN